MQRFDFTKPQQNILQPKRLELLKTATPQKGFLAQKFSKYGKITVKYLFCFP